MPTRQRAAPERRQAHSMAWRILITGANGHRFCHQEGRFPTASGIINGFSSAGQILGVTLSGRADKLVGQGRDIWNPILLWLGVAFALGGLLLAPQWNRVPPSAPTKS